jgi:hypothetical protein
MIDIDFQGMARAPHCDAQKRQPCLRTTVSYVSGLYNEPGHLIQHFTAPDGPDEPGHDGNGGRFARLNARNLYQPAVTLTLRHMSTALITRDFVVARRVSVNADWY